MKDIFASLGREVEIVPIGSVHSYKRNARTHKKSQVKKLANNIREGGWGSPIMVDENSMILAGHCRYEAAKFLNLTHIPVVRRIGLTENEKKAYIIADNRMTDESAFDNKILKLDLADLSTAGFDLSLTGLESLEIDRILSLDDQDPHQDEEAVHLPDDDVVAVSRAGDLWHCGETRLLNGDARMIASYDALLAGERAQLIFTDPPYGCAIANNVSGLGKVKHRDFLMGAGEESLPEFAHSLLRPALRCMAAHALPGALAFICTDWRASPYLHDAAQGIFAEHKNTIVWAKTNAGMGSCYRSAHEFIQLYKISPGTHINNFGLGEGGRHRSNVWMYPGANTFRKGRMEDLADHSTVKPRRLVEDAIIDTSKRGGIVLDPFVGSGTTLAAAQVTGRRGYGIELDPVFVDVALRRLSELVGEPALLSGKIPFDEVAAARRADQSGEAA